MKKAKIHTTLFFSLFSVLVLIQPFTHFFNLPIAIILLLNWIIEGRWSEKMAILDNSKKRLIFGLFLTFFGIYILGIFYSSNLQQAISEIEYKIMFLIAPLIIFTSSSKHLNRQRALFLFNGFIISSLLVIFTNFALSFSDFTEGGGLYSFTYKNLSHFAHPSYHALQISTAFILSFYLLFIKKERLRRCNYLYFATLIIFPLYIFLLQSKAALLSLAIIIFLMGIYLLNRKKRNSIGTFAFTFICIILPITLFFTVPEPYNRFKPAIKELFIQEQIGTQTSTSIRVIVWESCWELGWRHPLFGVGTGDCKDELLKEYERRGHTHIQEREFNAHNQYLQIFISLGFTGLAIFICYLFIPLGYAVRSRETTYLLFLFLIIINLFPESMLERRAGADFIALFNTLLCHYFIFRGEEKEHSFPTPLSSEPPSLSAEIGDQR